MFKLLHKSIADMEKREIQEMALYAHMIGENCNELSGMLEKIARGKLARKRLIKGYIEEQEVEYEDNLEEHYHQIIMGGLRNMLKFMQAGSRKAKSAIIEEIEREGKD